MLIKTKELIICLSIVILVFVASCNSKKDDNKVWPVVKKPQPQYVPPVYRYPRYKHNKGHYYDYRRNDNDQYYTPLKDYDDNLDDNRDRLYR